MTEPRIASLVQTMEEAAQRLSGMAHRTTLFRLGDRTVALKTTEHFTDCRITVEDAFINEPSSNKPEFQLTLIDDAMVGASPHIDWPSSWHAPLGIVHASHTSPYLVALDVHSMSVSTFDPRSRQAIVWFPSVEAISSWYAATPFRLQLSWFANTFNGEMIHAAGLVVDSMAVLIVGPSGAGKSTLTLSAVLEGVPTLGDDFLLIQGSRAAAVYRRVKVHDASRILLGDPITALGPIMNLATPDEKRIVALPTPPLSLDCLPIRAVFVPKQGRRAVTRRISGGEAIRSTLGPTMMGLLGGSPSTLKRITRIIESAPAFEIEVGPDMSENVDALLQTVRTIPRRSEFTAPQASPSR